MGHGRPHPLRMPPVSLLHGCLQPLQVLFHTREACFKVSLYLSSLSLSSADVMKRLGQGPQPQPRQPQVHPTGCAIARGLDCTRQHICPHPHSFSTFASL
jgi:hypothetical protein